MSAYYNEYEPFAAQWLRNLIAADLIAPGDVDERDIREVQAEDVQGYTQVHLFAGIGVWSYALRRAGWSDERAVWTGSCPCQPFSVAGKGRGTADERHLWPEMFRLIRGCRPIAVLGEQVSSQGGLAWLDLVSTDLEGEGYTVGAVDTCAAGFGAPHIRQRLWWVAHTLSGGPRGGHHGPDARDARDVQATGPGGTRGVDHTNEGRPLDAVQAGRPSPGIPSEVSGMGDTHTTGRPIRQSEHTDARTVEASSPTSGFWSSADWLPCRDGKWRSTGPGIFPLVWAEKGKWAEVDTESELESMADGPAFRVVRSSTGRALGQYPFRVGMLRGYGNALVAPQAEAFVRAYMEVVNAPT